MFPPDTAPMRARLSPALTALLFVSAVATAQTTSTWNNTTGNWTDFARWSTNPLFPNNGNGGQNYNAVVNGGAVTVNQDIAIQGLTFGGGTITRGAGFTLTTNAPWNWSAGTLDGTGTLQVNGGGSLSGDRFVETGMIRFGGGTFTHTGGAQLVLNTGAQARVQTGAVYLANATANGSFGTNVVSTGGGTFAVESGGTLQKQGGFNLNFNSTTLANNAGGLIDIQQGTLNVTSGTFSSNAGTVQVASGANFQGNITNAATGVVRGAGTVTGNVNLSAVGATLEAGNGTADPNLTVTNGLTMAVDSRYRVQLYGTGVNDISRVNVSGGTTNILTGADLQLDLSALDATQVDALRTAVGQGNTRSYTVLTATGGISGGGFNTANFSVSNIGLFASGEWTFGSTSGGTVTLNFQPVPEPASVLGVGVLGLAVIGAVRRKWARSAG